MIFFDSHAHFFDEKFGDEESRDATIKEALDSGVGYVLNAGTSPTTSRLALSLADKYEGFYASVGIHPEDLSDIIDPESALEEIKKLSLHPKAVAIGEIGLDYYWTKDNKEQQRYWFERQLDLASELSLPVIIHDREAHGDCLEIVSRHQGITGVFHSFSGSAEMAKELVKLGWYISFSGVITFKNAQKPVEALECVPADRLLIETDCPYLTPHPHRGKLNHSGYVRYTAEKIAELKGLSPEQICKITCDNAFNLFSKAKKQK